MALTPEAKAQVQADLLFKKDIGVAISDPKKAFFEESVPSQQLVFPSQIMAQADQIPQTAAEVPGVVEKVIDEVLTAIPGAGSSGFYSANLVGVIPYNYGDGSYLYTLKKADDSPIPFGQNSWVFDPGAGTLFFMDGLPADVSAAAPPKMTAYRYVGDYGAGSPSSTYTRAISLQGNRSFRYSAGDNHRIISIVAAPEITAYRVGIGSATPSIPTLPLTVAESDVLTWEVDYPLDTLAYLTFYEEAT